MNISLLPFRRHLTQKEQFLKRPVCFGLLFKNFPLDGSQGTRLAIYSVRPLVWPALHLLGPLLSPHSVDFLWWRLFVSSGRLASPVIHPIALWMEVKLIRATGPQSIPDLLLSAYAKKGACHQASFGWGSLGCHILGHISLWYMLNPYSAIHILELYSQCIWAYLWVAIPLF